MNFGNFSFRNRVHQRSYICREKCFAFVSVRILNSFWRCGRSISNKTHIIQKPRLTCLFRVQYQHKVFSVQSLQTCFTQNEKIHSERDIKTAPFCYRSRRCRSTRCPGQRYTKIHAFVLVRGSFMKFIFSTVYRVTQKDFYAGPYTSMWAPFVASQISKRYSSSCHAFISM